MALQFISTQNIPSNDASDCIIVGAYSNKTFTDAGMTIDKASNGRLSALTERGDISGKSGQALLLQDLEGVKASRVLIIGLGDPDKFAVPQFLKAVADAVRFLRTGPVKQAYLTLTDIQVKGRDANWAVRQAIIAADHAAYEYTATRSKKPAGPTTATRMDGFTEMMLGQTGLIAMIGKAERGPTAIEAIRKHKSAYLMAVGGAAYLVSKAIKTAKVVGFADLGMEAIYEFDVVDMPVTVAVDAGGTSAHITGPAEWQKRIATGEFKGIAVAGA